jgi:hypothetical protein
MTGLFLLKRYPELLAKKEEEFSSLRSIYSNYIDITH